VTGLPKGSGASLGTAFACVSIDGLAPIILGYLYVREIRFIGEYAKFSKAELG
jgi:hypothetical protein